MSVLRQAAEGQLLALESGTLRLDRRGQQALALELLAGELAGAANGLGLLTRLLLGGLLVMAAELHLAENTLALQLLLESAESLIDIIVANENLHVIVRL
jgi:hypothetical protein